MHYDCQLSGQAIVSEWTGPPDSQPMHCQEDGRASLYEATNEKDSDRAVGKYWTVSLSPTLPHLIEHTISMCCKSEILLLKV